MRLRTFTQDQKKEPRIRLALPINPALALAFIGGPILWVVGLYALFS